MQRATIFCALASALHEAVVAPVELSMGQSFWRCDRFYAPNRVGGAEPFIDGDEPALTWEQEFEREVASIEALPFVKGEPAWRQRVSMLLIQEQPSGAQL